MKKPVIILLMLLLALPVYAADEIEQTIHHAFGVYEPDPYIAGVFKIEHLGDIYPNVIWYRTLYSAVKDPLTQAGEELFTYQQMAVMFENTQIDTYEVLFCFDYKTPSSQHDKVLMVIVDRDDFDFIDPKFYEPYDFPIYFKIRSADLPFLSLDSAVG